MCKALEDWERESREEGREEGRKEIVLNLLKKGLLLEDICELVECDMSYVENLKISIN